MKYCCMLGSTSIFNILSNFPSMQSLSISMVKHIAFVYWFSIWCICCVTFEMCFCHHRIERDEIHLSTLYTNKLNHLNLNSVTPRNVEMLAYFNHVFHWCHVAFVYCSICFGIGVIRDSFFSGFSLYKYITDIRYLLGVGSENIE